MEQNLITRRKAFAAAGAAAGALGATAALSGVLGVQAASGGVGNSIVGTWDVLVMPSVGNPSTTLIAFAAGGSLVTTDNAGPGNISVGAWEQEGKEFRVVFETFIFDNKGVLVATSVIRPRGTLDGDDDHIHGSYTVDVFPASGPPQHNAQHGTFRGGRLKP
jgi:hypothetical protein